MNTIVRCPVTGRACSEGACRERHWCRQLFERGLSHRGLPLKRKFRPRCWVSRRNVHRAQDEGWSRPDRRSTATALEGISVTQILWLCQYFGVRPHDARTRVQLAKATIDQAFDLKSFSSFVALTMLRPRWQLLLRRAAFGGLRRLLLLRRAAQPVQLCNSTAEVCRSEQSVSHCVCLRQ